MGWFWNVQNGLFRIIDDKRIGATDNCIKSVPVAQNSGERMVFTMDYDKIVCNCCQVTNGMIKDAVDGGAKTLEEVQDVTGAGTVCGACLEDVRHLVEQFVKEQE